MTRRSVARPSIGTTCQHKVSEDFPLYREASLCSRQNGSVQVVSDAMLLSNNLLVEGLDLRPGQRLLDMHCGTGHLSIHLAMKYRIQVVGLCPDEVRVQAVHHLAERRGVSHLAQFQAMNPLNLQLPDGHFDVVICNDAFESCSDIDLCAKEVARVLRKGGQWRGLDAFRFEPPKDSKARIPNATEEKCEINSFPMWGEVERAFHQAGIAPLITHDLTPDLGRPETAQVDHSLIRTGPGDARIKDMSDEEIEDSEVMAACAIFGTGILDGSIKYILAGGIKI